MTLRRSLCVHITRSQSRMELDLSFIYYEVKVGHDVMTVTIVVRYNTSNKTIYLQVRPSHNFSFSSNLQWALTCSALLDVQQQTDGAATKNKQITQRTVLRFCYNKAPRLRRSTASKELLPYEYTLGKRHSRHRDPLRLSFICQLAPQPTHKRTS